MQSYCIKHVSFFVSFEYVSGHNGCSCSVWYSSAAVERLTVGFTASETLLNRRLRLHWLSLGNVAWMMRQSIPRWSLIAMMFEQRTICDSADTAATKMQRGRGTKEEIIWNSTSRKCVRNHLSSWCSWSSSWYNRYGKQQNRRACEPADPGWAHKFALRLASH